MVIYVTYLARLLKIFVRHMFVLCIKMLKQIYLTDILVTFHFLCTVILTICSLYNAYTDLMHFLQKYSHNPLGERTIC